MPAAMQTIEGSVSTPCEPLTAVLVVGPPELAGRLVGAMRKGRRRLSVVVTNPSSPGQLLKAFGQYRPHIAVLDVERCREFGMESLRELRRAVPQMTWLAGWIAPNVHSLDILVEGQIRGAVSWSDPTARLTQALDAVCAGEMWLPRHVMQALVSMLELQREGHAATPPEGTSVKTDSCPPLTRREQEVVSLAHEGLTNKVIAQQLQICPDTVKKHLSSAFGKLHVRRRRQILL